jgi:hypothetical protein
LKGVLKKYAQIVKTGDNRNKWTLKDELRTKPRAETSSESTEKKKSGRNDDDMDIELGDEEDDYDDASDADDDVEMAE